MKQRKPTSYQTGDITVQKKITHSKTLEHNIPTVYPEWVIKRTKDTLHLLSGFAVGSGIGLVISIILNIL